MPSAYTLKWCWLFSEHSTMVFGSSVLFWLRNHEKEILPLAVVPLLPTLSRASLSFPPSPPVLLSSLSHCIIVCVTLPHLQAMIRSCWYKALAKFLNCYSGQSAIFEQSGRALSGNVSFFGVMCKLLLLREKNFLCYSCCPQL